MAEDIKNIGISERMDMKLKEFTESDNLFVEMKDGYRLAASIAIYKNLKFEDRVLVNRKNKYDVGGVDEDSIFKNIISEKYPHLKGLEYRSLEKLADVGVEYLAEKISDSRVIDIEKLMKDDT